MGGEKCFEPQLSKSLKRLASWPYIHPTTMPLGREFVVLVYGNTLSLKGEI